MFKLMKPNLKKENTEEQNIDLQRIIYFMNNAFELSKKNQRLPLYIFEMEVECVKRVVLEINKHDSLSESENDFIKKVIDFLYKKNEKGFYRHQVKNKISIHYEEFGKFRGLNYTVKNSIFYRACLYREIEEKLFSELNPDKLFCFFSKNINYFKIIMFNFGEIKSMPLSEIQLNKLISMIPDDSIDFLHIEENSLILRLIVTDRFCLQILKKIRKESFLSLIEYSKKNLSDFQVRTANFIFFDFLNLAKINITKNSDFYMEGNYLFSLNGYYKKSNNDQGLKALRYLHDNKIIKTRFFKSQNTNKHTLYTLEKSPYFNKNKINFNGKEQSFCVELSYDEGVKLGKKQLRKEALNKRIANIVALTREPINMFIYYIRDLLEKEVEQPVHPRIMVDLFLYKNIEINELKHVQEFVSKNKNHIVDGVLTDEGADFYELTHSF